MNKALLVEVFGDIFEHTPQIAERAFEKRQDTAKGLHETLVSVMRTMSDKEKLALINAHPDLAGKLALAKILTDDSTKEQASAGLDTLTAQELHEFTTLNDTYKAKFGFPFIFAVKGKTKDDILKSFRTRIHHSKEAEFKEALTQIERIALLRLETRLP
jgi:OHCU decarboxylase